MSFYFLRVVVESYILSYELVIFFGREGASGIADLGCWWLCNLSKLDCGLFCPREWKRQSSFEQIQFGPNDIFSNSDCLLISIKGISQCALPGTWHKFCHTQFEGGGGSEQWSWSKMAMKGKARGCIDLRRRKSQFRTQMAITCIHQTLNLISSQNWHCWCDIKSEESFKGHGDLILGFTTSLPKGYEITLPS